MTRPASVRPAGGDARPSRRRPPLFPLNEPPTAQRLHENRLSWTLNARLFRTSRRLARPWPRRSTTTTKKQLPVDRFATCRMPLLDPPAPRSRTTPSGNRRQSQRFPLHQHPRRLPRGSSSTRARRRSSGSTARTTSCINTSSGRARARRRRMLASPRRRSQRVRGRQQQTRWTARRGRRCRLSWPWRSTAAQLPLYLRLRCASPLPRARVRVRQGVSATGGLVATSRPPPGRGTAEPGCVWRTRRMPDGHLQARNRGTGSVLP